MELAKGWMLTLGLFAGAGGTALGQAAAIGTPPVEEHVIRVWGYKGFAPQLERWEAAYRKLHPEIRFENQLHSPATVMAGLYDGVSDVALMGREIWPVETMAYHWVFQQQPFGIDVATCGLNAPGQSFTPVVMVNEKSPVTGITPAELDAIYGSEHRAAPTNIRTWGELGATGEWAGKAIDVYGFGPEDALGVYFRHDILKMDFKPNPASHLLSDHDAGGVPSAQRIAKAVAEDANAIGYGSAQNAKVKVLAVSGVAPTEATLKSHEYPLTRTIAVYFRRFPDKPLEAKVDGFVRFLLTPEAQGMVRPDEGLIPLNDALVAKQVKKLNSPMPKDAAVVEDGGQ